MNKELEIKLQNNEDLHNFLFNQTNFDNKSIQPDFILSLKDGIDNFITIRETQKPYISIVDYSGIFEDLDNRFNIGDEIEYTDFFEFITEIEKEYNISFYSMYIL